MLRREAGFTEKIERPSEESHEGRTRNKVASLAPYLAEIERRKKLRSIGKKSKKNLNESSSKSFRIKEKSVTSLQKEAVARGRDTSSNLVAKLLQERGNRERKARSVQRNHEMEYSKTIESRPQQQKTNNNFFNDLYVRVKNKVEKDQKERPLRKKLYETLEEQRAKSQQAGEISMYKIGYTHATTNQHRNQPPNVNSSLSVANTNPVNPTPPVNNVNNAPTSKRDPDIENKKRTEQPKKNFRRNKYEALQSSVTSNPVEACKASGGKDYMQSDNHIELDKKESNVSINKQMDRIAERQMENFYIEVRNKQIHRSIQKSTEKYFKYESYRPAKSKNDIEVCISTIKNPSLHKVSHSTNDREEKAKSQAFTTFKDKKAEKNECLHYDFDFKNQDEDSYSQINQIDNPSEEESSLRIDNSQSVFEEQRRKVEAEYFHKEQPHLDWSEDLCKVDQI